MGGWQWRARIEEESGQVLGAGFLVDSTHVVTCAHVVIGRQQTRVSFPSADVAGLPATVGISTDWAKAGDDGDIAILTLHTPVTIPPAVFATPDALQGRRLTDLGAYGFPRSKEDSGSVVTLSTRSDMDLRNEWWQLDVPQAHLEVLKHGFSGAAVYVADSGEIVGMVTDMDRGVDGRSGRMLPLRGIRTYWEDIDDLLELGWLTAEARRRLREIVRDAAPTVPIDDICRAALPEFLLERRLRSVWDAITYIAEEHREEDALQRLLLGLLGHLDMSDQGRLTAWMRHWMPAASPSRRAAPTSIVVRLDRKTRTDTYDLTVQSLVDGATGPSSGTVEVRADEIREKVERALPRVRDVVIGRDWIIEFALPVTLFNEPFEAWYLEKDEENGIRIRMGSYPVVVRDVQRMKPNSIRWDLTTRRWRRLRERGTTLPYKIDCGHPTAEEEFQDRLDADEECCVLIYAAAPSVDMLNAALNSGIPIMLWPRRTCPDQSHDDCPAGRTLEALAKAIAKTPPDDVPGTVMKLRKQAKTRRAGEHHHGRALALLWDDPTRLPDPPLSMGN
jgi:vWA-MoxR associated protein C-terminal domain/vWA-MoxR associated protein middle region (VMAP-M) 8/Trypsin-like peptidase domain